MAADLGTQLLRDVEEVGFEEILQALRFNDGIPKQRLSFGFPLLDRLLNTTTEERPRAANTQSCVELKSLHAGGGATHLLYHLTALAVLPKELGGRQCCAVICDTDGQFDVKRLVIQLKRLTIGHSSPESVDKETILPALRHVHILRPQSLESLTAALSGLPTYLFSKHKHYSFDRAVGFVAIDSASAFYWQDRAETEDAAFLAKTSAPTPQPVETVQSGYVPLATALRKACSILQCPAILTSWYLGPVSTTPNATRSFRPSLPGPLSTLVALRLAIQRIAVRKFPPLISVERALQEAEKRQKAVEEGRFECFVNEWGTEERLLRNMQRNGGSGFAFQITQEGVLFNKSSTQTTSSEAPG